MARTNKYASLNFNDIYDKKNNNKTINNNTSPSSTSNSNKTKITNSRIHGNMLVLSRPTPKPISLPPSQTQIQTKTPPPPTQQPQPKSPVNPDPNLPASDSDSISLRPLGRTGGSAIAAAVSRSPRELCFVSSAKPDKFVPPHLRPGYVCKEEKQQPVSPVVVKNREFSGGYRQRPKSGEEGRPKSGGVGYERMRRGGGPDFVFRPGSSGNNRPNSTG